MPDTEKTEGKKMKNKRNKKGFTLAELLIVVAIIAVLVAIAIPVFNSQLEKSREATDLANIRAAYAEATVKILDEGGETATATTTATMQSTGKIDKVSGADTTEIGGVKASSITITKGQKTTVTVDADGKITGLSGGASMGS